MVQKVIIIEDLKRAALDTGKTYTSVQILKTYPIQRDCTPTDHYANLYICKKRLTNPDTIYVFDECAQPPDFVIDTSMNVEVGFSTRDTLKNPPKQVTIFVPKEFRMPKNAKYLFVKLKETLL